MNHFRFKIPTNEDGSRVSYSPNWHGTIQKCPKNVTVLLYNDKEGYGIAQTEESFVPIEVTKITETEAKNILASVKNEPQVYFGAKIADLWDYSKTIDKSLLGMEEIAAALALASSEVTNG